MSIITKCYYEDCPEFNETRKFEIDFDREYGFEDKFMGSKTCEDEEFCQRAKLNNGFCPIMARLIGKRFGRHIP